ncbi:MAG: molybdenum cofactor biosynthesis protein MoaE [Terriglobales bacterium]
MQVRVLFFGMLKDLAGRGSEVLDLPEDATLKDVVVQVSEQIPGLDRLLPSIAMSINQEYAGPESKLNAGDEIALLPPVSGGSQSLQRQCAAIVRDRIDTRSLLDQIKQPEDGAAVVFEGVVRNHTRGRRTLYLDYEAYEGMALKQMEMLAGQALSQFAVRDVAIVHRLGRLQVGEISVAIVVASAHRSAAFEACRWLIETLKRTVPIWKKEYFEDGAVWADGEPFPPELVGPGSSPAGKPASK